MSDIGLRPFSPGRMRKQLERTGPKATAPRVTADELLGIWLPVLHGYPIEGVTPCCNRSVFDLPRQDQIAQIPEHVTCGSTVPVPVMLDPACVANWPDCYEGGYDPSCCRFPKSCSVDLVPVGDRGQQT